MAITHVFFDVDGVLINGFHSLPEHRIRWDRNMQADLNIDPLAFQEQFFNQVWANVVIGKASLLETLTPVLNRLNPAITAEQMRDYWFTQDALLNTEVVEFARSLKPTYQTFVATNQEHERAAYLRDNLGFGAIFNDIFYSAKLGMEKKDPKFFHHICKQLNIQPENALLIDDTASVIASAKQAGFQTLYFSHPEQLDELKKLLPVT